MNRPIKFRAWADGEMIMSIENNLGYYRGTKDECVLMQFTGLLDKNGKEIYEGDVVGIVMKDGSGKIYPYGQIVFTDKSKYQPSGGARLGWAIEGGEYPFEHDDYYGGFFNEGLEIIGNIYENPELIGK